MAGLYAFVCPVLCQEELRKEKREREQVEQEKDITIADLQHKLDNMERDYEKILHVSCNTSHLQASVGLTSPMHCKPACTAVCTL